MAIITQLYKDKGRRIKAYPKTLASQTYMSDKVTSVESVIEEKVLKPDTGPSTDRPVGALTGKMFYDTTLNKPIWFDGNVWKDAIGTEI